MAGVLGLLADPAARERAVQGLLGTELIPQSGLLSQHQIPQPSFTLGQMLSAGTEAAPVLGGMLEAERGFEAARSGQTGRAVRSAGLLALPAMLGGGGLLALMARQADEASALLRRFARQRGGVGNFQASWRNKETGEILEGQPVHAMHVPEIQRRGWEPEKAESGFVDENGRFLTREEAFARVEKEVPDIGQVQEEAGIPKGRRLLAEGLFDALQRK